MTDLEELIRETFAHRAEQAPPAESLVAGVRNRRRRRHLNRTIVAVATVAAATTAAVVLPLTLAGHDATRPTDKPRPPAVPSSDEQIIGFHGIEITVPASWKVNVPGCAGRGTADTVIRDLGPSIGCEGGSTTTRRISSVELGTIVEPLRFSKTDEFVNPSGVRIQQGTMRGGNGTTLVIPAVGVVVNLQTATAGIGAQLTDSIRIVDTDVTGCAMRDHVLNPPAGRHAAPAPLVPDDTPTAVAICHYENYWLVSATTLTGSHLDQLVGVIKNLPQGFSHARPADYLPSICTQTAASGGELGTGYVLHWHGAGGKITTEWAHMGYCGPLGITNGVLSGRLTLELAQAINRPLHRGFGIPGHLLPGPG